MRTRRRTIVYAISLLLLASLSALVSRRAFGQGSVLLNLFPFANSSGFLQTYDARGAIDLQNPFFQSLGTNDRTCASCHQPDQGWSISAAGVRRRFQESAGLDPIFRTNDGSNCNHDIDVASVRGRRQAYSLLSSRGLIRIALPVPSNAEFDVTNVANRYGCAEKDILSVYRRPLPTTNLRFLSVVMWDGRESTPPSTEKIAYVSNPNDLLFDLAHQALGAANGHEQADTPLPAESQQQIVDFEMSLFTAQGYDFKAGSLYGDGGGGGPMTLASQGFHVGINDPLGLNPLETPFTPVVFTLFDSWRTIPPGRLRTAKASIARGQELFNSKPIDITGVAGLNDDLGMTDIPGTCGTCHDAPNVGNHSVAAPLNIGVGDLSNPLGIEYLPVITLRNKTTGDVIQTTDPGRALITGKWKDVGRMKGPILRGLASRPPYFHNGAASTLADVVEFYNQRFTIGLTAEEKSDLVAFLSAL